MMVLCTNLVFLATDSPSTSPGVLELVRCVCTLYFKCFFGIELTLYHGNDQQVFTKSKTINDNIHYSLFTTIHHVGLKYFDRI